MTNKYFLNNCYFRRGLAFYIDGIIITVITLIYLFIFDEKGATIECDNFICWNTCRVLSFQILFYFIYFLLMEFFFKLTLGKVILGFYVSGKKNKTFFWRILMRTILRLIPLNLFSFFFDKQNEFWHEKITNIHTMRKNK